MPIARFIRRTLRIRNLLLDDKLDEAFVRSDPISERKFAGALEGQCTGCVMEEEVDRLGPTVEFFGRNLPDFGLVDVPIEDAVFERGIVNLVARIPSNDRLASVEHPISETGTRTVDFVEVESASVVVFVQVKRYRECCIAEKTLPALDQSMVAVEVPVQIDAIRVASGIFFQAKGIQAGEDGEPDPAFNQRCEMFFCPM